MEKSENNAFRYRELASVLSQQRLVIILKKLIIHSVAG